MISNQILILTLLFFVVVLLICSVVYINSPRKKITMTKKDGVIIEINKKAMKNGAVFSDNFGENENRFQYFLRCYGATISYMLTATIVITLFFFFYLWSS